MLRSFALASGGGSREAFPPTPRVLFNTFNSTCLKLNRVREIDCRQYNSPSFTHTPHERFASSCVCTVADAFFPNSLALAGQHSCMPLRKRNTNICRVTEPHRHSQEHPQQHSPRTQSPCTPCQYTSPSCVAEASSWKKDWRMRVLGAVVKNVVSATKLMATVLVYFGILMWSWSWKRDTAHYAHYDEKCKACGESYTE